MLMLRFQSLQFVKVFGLILEAILNLLIGLGEVFLGLGELSLFTFSNAGFAVFKSDS